MVKRRYHETIDWGEYWKAAKGDKVTDKTPKAKYTVEPLLEFFEKKGVPDTYADVGCGLGSAVFSVAEEYPDTETVGYDCIDRILGINLDKAVEEGYDNISFKKADLPDFYPDRQFEVITSFFTLCYISDIKKMLQNLYDAVKPGGYLIITYHNKYA
ncbi:MAG: class I SAM-dependent methyltransferase [Thermoplasmatota archaeon]